MGIAPRGRAKSKNKDLCSHLPRTVQTLDQQHVAFHRQTPAHLFKTDVFAYSPA